MGERIRGLLKKKKVFDIATKSRLPKSGICETGAFVNIYWIIPEASPHQETMTAVSGKARTWAHYYFRGV